MSLLAGSAGADTVFSYHIGNSLTHGISPDGLAAMAAGENTDLHVGYHIRLNKPLDYIWQHPDEVSFTNAYGPFQNALANVAWDFIVLQPYLSDCDGALVSDKELERAREFIDLLDAGPSIDRRIYILMTWLCSSTADYQSAWSRIDTDDPYEPDTLNRQGFYWLRDSLLEHYGSNAKIYLLPVGDVMYELDIQFRAGKFPGFERIQDVFKDRIHLTNEVGNWIAVNVMYATVFGQDPTGLGKPDGFFGGPASAALSREQSDQLQTLIWGVVSNHSYAGVVQDSVSHPAPGVPAEPPPETEAEEAPEARAPSEPPEATGEATPAQALSDETQPGDLPVEASAPEDVATAGGGSSTSWASLGLLTLVLVHRRRRIA